MNFIRVTDIQWVDLDRRIILHLVANDMPDTQKEYPFVIMIVWVKEDTKYFFYYKSKEDALAAIEMMDRQPIKEWL